MGGGALGGCGRGLMGVEANCGPEDGRAAGYWTGWSHSPMSPGHTEGAEHIVQRPAGHSVVVVVAAWWCWQAVLPHLFVRDWLTLACPGVWGCVPQQAAGSFPVQG